MRKALILVILALVAGFGLYRMGFVRFNYPDVGRYPVLGVDVSHHQGPIRWSELRSSGISFAFIKATEGADHQDAAFALNWQQAGAAGVARGAYHFFTFCADGSAQADNFIATVPALGGELPPVADVEFGGNCKEWPSVEEIREGIKHGVRKVNIDTDIRLAMTGAMRRLMFKKPDEFDPRKFLADATKAAREICKLRFEAFGSAGKASLVKPIALDKITDLYTVGKLRPLVH